MPSGDRRARPGDVLSPGHVRLQGKLICQNAEQAELVARNLPDHIRLTLAEPGCLSFAVERTEDPLVWTVSECFDGWPAFDAHQLRTRASAWWDATRDIPREYEMSGPERES